MIYRPDSIYLFQFSDWKNWLCIMNIQIYSNCIKLFLECVILQYYYVPGISANGIDCDIEIQVCLQNCIWYSTDPIEYLILFCKKIYHCIKPDLIAQKSSIRPENSDLITFGYSIAMISIESMSLLIQYCHIPGTLRYFWLCIYYTG